MTECHIDAETRSDVDIKMRGSYVYFESPHTCVLMISYRFGAGAILRWLPGQPCPGDIRQHAERGGVFVAHNAAFEFSLWTTILTPKHGWPAVRIEQFRCTLATASALGLPRSLERLGEALDLKVKKDKIGKALIKFFCTPIGWRDGAPLFNEPAGHPAKFEQFRDYCDDDVRTESEADGRMIPLSNDEQAIWVLDQRINQRGIRIDRRSAIAAINLVEKAKAQLDAQMDAATGGNATTRGAVTACTQVVKLTAWIEAQGVPIGSIAKDDILEALDLDDLPQRVRTALALRQEAAKSSTTKLKTFLRYAGREDRVRGSFVYHGAAPGRWSNVGVNFGNMPRPRAIFDDAKLDPAALFSAIRTESPDALRMLYGDDLGKPLHLVADSIRGFILAAPGKDLIAVDYSGIQGAIGAWLADETWKLAAMREIIRDPTLPDLYRRAAAGILNTTTDVITKKHHMRQAVGKTSELALLFAGGVSALVSMAANYGMRRRALHDLYPPIWTAASEEAREAAVRRWERNRRGRDKRKTDVLTREAWLACSLIVASWRASNPASVKAWADLEDAMRRAMRAPGTTVPALGAYLFKQGFLWRRLPSGRCIAYGAPRLRDQVWARVLLDDGTWTEPEVCDREETEALERRGRARIEGATSPKVTALGVDAQTQKLVRYALYGGLAMENNCLGIESDILRIGMRAAESAGYPITMHNYDEIVAEVDHGFGSIEEMERLMLDLPPIYAGLPLAAHGWRGKRYRK